LLHAARRSYVLPKAYIPVTTTMKLNK